MTSLKSFTSFTTKYGRDIELQPLGYIGKGLLIVRSHSRELRAVLEVKDAVRLRDALNRLLHQEDQPVGDVGSTGQSTGPHLSWAGRSERALPRIAKLFDDLAEASRENDVMISFTITPYDVDGESE